MKAKVICVGKEEFTNKSGKTSYVLHLLDVTDICNVRVHRAFTSAAHYNKIEANENFVNWDVDEEKEGYLNFDNGYTHFYLPKDEVNKDE